MKRCVGCEAKAAGATTWQVGYIVGAHHSEVMSDDRDDESREPELCALHLYHAAKAWMVSVLPHAELGRMLIERERLDPDAPKPVVVPAHTPAPGAPR